VICQVQQRGQSLIYTPCFRKAMTVFNNSVENEPIVIIFGTVNPEKKLEISGYNFVHHTGKM